MAKLKTALGKKIGDRVKQVEQRGPVWEGPESLGANGGVTQSLLGRWLSCRERFRLYAIEGLAVADEFNLRLHYGNMWHACEEALAADPKSNSWLVKLREYCQGLSRRYLTSGEQIKHWYNVCLVQFPLYVDWWAKHPDVKGRKPLLQEQVFDVPYKLPSGRIVRLRGKWDSVDLIDGGIYLQENKSKGDIRAQQLKEQLLFDLQTLLYLVALQEYQIQSKQYRLGNEGIPRGAPIKGIRYNVIRRPLSGGKGSIVQHKPSKSNPDGESAEHFYARLGDIIREAIEPNGDHFFFMRWRVEISPADIERFKRECLNPILEELVQWYDWVTSGNPWREGNTLHHRFPYGVWNPALEGRSGDLDEHLSTGSTLGLRHVENLFTELTDAERPEANE